MAYIAVECPHCKSTKVNEHGVSAVGKQRYRCVTCGKTFQLKYTYAGCEQSIRSKVYYKTINGSGTRAIARELGISRNTVTSILRSFEEDIWYVNPKFFVFFAHTERKGRKHWDVKIGKHLLYVLK